jgi:hypothetical protein
MSFNLNLLTLATLSAVAAASLWPTSTQSRIAPMVQMQNAGGVKEVGYRDRYRYGYRPYYRRYGYYRPRYRPYYGYPLDLETYTVWRNKRPTWFDY